MKRKISGLYIVAFVLAVFSKGWSQDAPVSASTTTLTLETAIQEALEHSPEYRKAQALEKEAGWGQFEAWSKGFLPHVTISGKQFFYVDYASEQVSFNSPFIPFPENFPKTTLSLDADFDLFDGFKNIHQVDAANNKHEAAKIISDWSLLRLEENVRLKFYEVLAGKLLSDMADDNVTTLEDHLRIVQDQLDNGQATKYDVLRVEVQLSEAKSEQISAHDNLALAREDLAKTVGTPGDNRPLSGDLPVLNLDEVLKSLPDKNALDSPQLKAMHLQALAAGDQSAASSASFWVPRVSLIGEYQWYNEQSLTFGQSTPNDLGVYPSSYFFGAVATWNILDGGESWAKANETNEIAKQAQDDYESAALETPYDFDLWKRKLVSSVALYKTRLEDVDKAKESARLATVGFKAGTRTTTDVLDAELEEFQASAGLVQAQLGSLEALIQLELVTGKRLIHD